MTEEQLNFILKHKHGESFSEVSMPDLSDFCFVIKLTCKDKYL